MITLQDEELLQSELDKLAQLRADGEAHRRGGLFSEMRRAFDAAVTGAESLLSRLSSLAPPLLPGGGGECPSLSAVENTARARSRGGEGGSAVHTAGSTVSPATRTRRALAVRESYDFSLS